MTVTARKYNPGFLSDDELIASFCVRTGEFASMVEVLRDSTGKANTHQIVIGPRGSGKTSLLLRVAAEIRRDADLSSRFFLIVFAEESYEVSTAGEFWLECLSRLADQAPRGEDSPDLRRTVTELREIRDDRTLGDRCLGVLQDFSDGEGRRLVLLVENLNMMFRDIADDDAGWRLRQTLQNDPRFLLLASATSRFDEIDKRDRAFYDLFRVVALRPLDTDGCAALWRTVSGRERAKKTIRALQILTGGSPRLLTIVARFGGKLSFRELMADLLDLVDDHTEYFKSHLDALPPQERRVYLALADLWKPATAREIADRARLDTSKCSAQLARLTEKGAVEVTGGSPRRKLYYLTERLYNIYYLMRRARGPVPMIEALIRLMEGMYSPDELKEFGARMAQEATGFDAKTLSLYRTAFERLVALPSLASHREELLALAPDTFAEQIGGYTAAPTAPTVAKELSQKAIALAEKGRLHEALDAWDKVVHRFGASESREDIEQVSLALVNKGTALSRSRRPEEALAVWDDVVQRFGANDARALPQAVARALAKKGALLSTMNRPRDELDAWDEIVQRFGTKPTPALLGDVVIAFVGRGYALIALNLPNEAVNAWDEVVRRFGNVDKKTILQQVAISLANKATALVELSRPEEALADCHEIMERFGSSEQPLLLEVVASSLINKGNALIALDRPDEALVAWNEVVLRFGANDSPAILEPIALALVNKGTALVNLSRPEEALDTWDEIVGRFGRSDRPELLDAVSTAFANKGAMLEDLNQPEEALVNWEEVERRFESSNVPALLELVAGSLVNKGAMLANLNRPEEALAAWDRLLHLFGENHTPAILDVIAGALVNKGTILFGLNRPEEAIAAWSEAEVRFETSEAPKIRKQLAIALVGKGDALFGLNRPEDAIAAWDEVVERFGDGNGSAFLDDIAVALVNKGAVLGWLNRPDEALAVSDEVIRRFDGRDELYALEAVAESLVNKGTILVGSNRAEEALAVWDEVVERYEASDLPMLRNAAEMALSKRASYELTKGRAVAAIEFVDRALRSENTGLPDSRLQGHLIRARAHLAEGEDAACVRDVEAVLATLPNLNPFPKDALDGLIELAVELGLEQMRDLIVASAAADLLLPLTTALELELGLEPRVAREVEEVAEDIRRDLAERRKAKSA